MLTRVIKERERDREGERGREREKEGERGRERERGRGRGDIFSTHVIVVKHDLKAKVQIFKYFPKSWFELIN